MLDWFFAGIWAEIWKWGVGTGIIVLCVAGAIFIPVPKIKAILVIAAVLVVAALIAYTAGIRDDAARKRAESAVLDRDVTATVTKAKKNTGWKDPYNSPKN